MPATNPITIYRGEDITLTFTMDPVVDITGWDIEFNVEMSGGQAITKTATVTNGPNGVFTVALLTTDTDLRPGIYQYDAWRMDDGSSRPLAVGTFTIVDVARLPTLP